MIQHSITVRNAMLDAIEVAIGASPRLQVRTGAPPATCAAAAAGTLLADIPMPADWMAAAANGSKVLAAPIQAAAEVLDYGLDWAAALPAGDSLATVAWSVAPAGQTLGTQGRDGSRAVVWVSGGSPGQVYTLACTVTTAAGRTMQEEISMMVTA